MHILRTALLGSAFLVLLAPASAQFNDKGTVHLAIGLAGGAHGTEYKTTISIFGGNYSDTETDGAATITVPIELDFGISKKFSLGLYLEPGSYLDSSATESNSMALVGLQPRFYFINGDRFAWLGSLQLGAAGLKIERDEAFTESSATYAGGNFGLGTGVVFQFTDLIGLQLHMRYMTTNMKLRDYTLNGNDVDLDNYEAELRTRGFAVQASLGFRF
ncbi:MAG: outer membrane beta-barrel protein [Flavobacteriales bacterium]|nr:outer membrane beta-barrel protein [Flavobacteriales bacterium]